MEHLLLAYALIFLGLLCMVAELAMFTHGVLAMIGLGAIIGGSVILLGRDPLLGMATLLVLFVAVPVLGRVLVSFWPHSPVGRKFFLQPPAGQTTIAQTPVAQELEQLRGKRGKTLSRLRPAGVVDFDGHRIDAVSEGPMIEPGQWVRCIDVKAGIVIVRESEPPAANSLEEMKL